MCGANETHKAQHKDAGIPSIPGEENLLSESIAASTKWMTTGVIRAFAKESQFLLPKKFCQQESQPAALAPPLTDTVILVCRRSAIALATVDASGGATPNPFPMAKTFRWNRNCSTHPHTSLGVASVADANPNHWVRIPVCPVPWPWFHPRAGGGL